MIKNKLIDLEVGRNLPLTLGMKSKNPKPNTLRIRIPFSMCGVLALLAACTSLDVNCSER